MLSSGRWADTSERSTHLRALLLWLYPTLFYSPAHSEHMSKPRTLRSQNGSEKGQKRAERIHSHTVFASRQRQKFSELRNHQNRPSRKTVDREFAFLENSWPIRASIYRWSAVFQEGDLAIWWVPQLVRKLCRFCLCLDENARSAFLRFWPSSVPFWLWSGLGVRVRFRGWVYAPSPHQESASYSSSTQTRVKGARKIPER